MKAKDVHAILRTTLSPWCKSNNLARLGSTPSTWYQEGPDQFHVTRIHLDAKFGYIHPLGGRMFLRAWRSEFLTPQPDGQPLTPRQLLPEALHRRMKELGDAVTRKALAADWRSVMQHLDANGRALFERTRADMEKSLHTPHVAGMRLDEMCYSDADDVTAWASFLVDAMPFVAAALSNRDKTESPTQRVE